MAKHDQTNRCAHRQTAAHTITVECGGGMPWATCRHGRSYSHKFSFKQKGRKVTIVCAGSAGVKCSHGSVDSHDVEISCPGP